MTGTIINVVVIPLLVLVELQTFTLVVADPSSGVAVFDEDVCLFADTKALINFSGVHFFGIDPCNKVG